MNLKDLILAIQEQGAQNVIVFPTGRFQFVCRHGTFNFDTIADLERAFAPSRAAGAVADAPASSPALTEAAQ